MLSLRYCLFLLALSFFIATPSAFAAPKQEKTWVYNVYLFGERHTPAELDDRFNTNKPFDPLNVREEVYLLQTNSFDLDLRNRTLKVKLAGIAHLPLPADLLEMSKAKGQAITIDLRNWKTLILVEMVHHDKNGANSIYETVYGEAGDRTPCSTPYCLLQPRKQIK